jgi:zinc protease
MTTLRLRLLATIVLAAITACRATHIPPPQSRPAPGSIPVPAAKLATEPNSTPPQASYSPLRPFPAIASDVLDNGLEIDVIERRALPVTDVELTINSGMASEGDRAGAARVTAEWLEAGGAGRWNSRQLRETVDALGASLDISVTRDSMRFGMAVTSDRLDAALEVISVLVQAPRFDRIEFDKLKQRELERVQSLARTSGNWMAQMWLQRRLFQLPIGVHPYASYDVLPSELERLSPLICKDWFRENVTPRNAHLSLVGDLTLANSRSAIERHFARWSGPEVRGFHPSTPEGLNKFEIFVVDRPSSTQSDIFLALLGPNRRESNFPMAAIAQQVVGGGVAGRLFLDLREKRSLAYSASAGIQELAAGPSVLYFAAGTQTSRTSETVGALLEHLDRMGSGQIEQEELDLAQHFLVDSMPIRWEQVQTLAAQLAQLRILALPNDYYDVFRDLVTRASAANVADFTASHYRRDRAVMVLAGDSKVVAPELTKYATVSIVEPSRNFRLSGQLPRTAGQ